LALEHIPFQLERVKHDNIFLFHEITPFPILECYQG
jgi:hypothetical protein